MVTVRAFIIVHFSFALYERYKFYIFFYQNFQFFYFHLDEQWGLMPCTYQSVWRAKNALQLKYKRFPAMSDLLRFEIWQVFLLEKPLSCVLMKTLMC